MKSSYHEELSAKLYINSSVVYKDMVDLRRFQNDYCKIISYKVY